MSSSPSLRRRYGHGQIPMLTQDQADAVGVLARLTYDSQIRRRPRGATLAQLESAGVNLKAVRQLVKIKRFFIDGDRVTDNQIVELGAVTSRPYPKVFVIKTPR